MATIIQLVRWPTAPAARPETSADAELRIRAALGRDERVFYADDQPGPSRVRLGPGGALVTEPR